MRRTTWSAAPILLVGGLCILGGEAWAQADSTAVALNPVAQFLGSLLDLSAKTIQDRASHIFIIFLIGLIAKLIMDAAKWVSRLLIYSEWGPLRYVFRNHQRSVTIHGLVINLLKYFVYFTALGYILKELGINYTTYLASLSVIGLAIGFGSQGLVQDVVTGFFILFENQFMVGDMVEISGQAGIVEDIGLRTTRLRNYFGAQVVLQNRNIPMATRYKKGACEAGVDVAIPAVEQAEKAANLLQQVGEELHVQFQEILMEAPRTVGLIELKTGELFVRLHATIWPAQQWVIDAQMLPRIREAFKREGIEIPADRVVSFYHLPEEDAKKERVGRKVRRTARVAPGRENAEDKGDF